MSLSTSKLQRIQELCVRGSYKRAVEIAVPPKGPVRGALVHAMITGLARSLGPGTWTEDEKFQLALKRAFVENGGRGFSQLELSESKEALNRLGVGKSTGTYYCNFMEEALDPYTYGST
ncbi:hypothetical protein Pmar_PMAR009604 [Perkinsus marinus ATCC 50983]|uniref:Uncharacterized protein n=1 Tax=Perkinsus marinus (strain ATCC 50983 / TXsc) TaxID=423536 RepID=C5LV25_PERM5|nr:hypothetical protein Pmar_PMAR009604 [Perkinsus marinus ATCC 50983]EEQ99417.1 hypothetical protein Pmar_PMAR009604 [Perkinsus marinus ATCC 50983]|eukprot:XP_002766700.1 hypothetical protein Pmar_PMAR009604 [Perkinsus marinus ATCC 50983]